MELIASSHCPVIFLFQVFSQLPVLIETEFYFFNVCSHMSFFPPCLNILQCYMALPLLFCFIIPPHHSKFFLDTVSIGLINVHCTIMYDRICHSNESLLIKYMTTSELKVQCLEVCKGNQRTHQREMLWAATTQVMSLAEEDREPGFDSGLCHSLTIL